MPIETLTTVTGWCAVINIGLLLLSTIALVSSRERITRLHARLFGLDSTALSAAYFQYLAVFKLLVLIFNVTPWIALKIVVSMTTS